MTTSPVAPLGDTLVPYILDLQRHPGRPAFSRVGPYRRQRWSRGQVLAVALMVHDWLAEVGVNAGEAVMLQGANGPAWVAAFCGCLLRGAVAVPIDAATEPAAAAEMARRADCRAGLGDAPVAPLAVPWRCLEDLSPGSLPAGVSLDPSRFARPQPGDRVEIVFTSGTTGRPQGVPLTHANLLASIHPIERGFRKRQRMVNRVRPRLLCLVPASHMFGQVVGILLPVLMGLPVVFLDDLRPRSIREALRRERVMAALAVPRLLQLLKDDLVREGLVPPRLAPEDAPWWRKAWRARRLRRRLGLRFAAWISGGARLDEDVEAFWDSLGYFVVQGYGMTETAPIISVSNPFARRRGNVGKPVSGQEVRIGDDGELWVRGANVASGYLDETDTGASPFQDGWLRTGDRVERDEQGRLFVRGRVKDVIVLADGTNVDPGLVEKTLESVLSVREAACIALEGNRGEEVHAALVMDETDADTAAAVAAANERLEAGQRIQGFSLWPEAVLPRTSTGKLRRAAVRETLVELRRAAGVAAGAPATGATGSAGGGETAAGTAAAASGAGTAAADPVLAALAEMTGRDAGSLAGTGDLDRELGLSSLDRLDLLVRLEEVTGRTLDETSVAEAATLSDLKHAVRRPPSKPLPMPRWSRTPLARAVRAAGRLLIVRPAFGLFVRLHVEGREHLQGLAPPFLLVANHESHMDTPAVLFGLPAGLRRHLAVAMATEHFPALFGDGGERERWWLHPRTWSQHFFYRLVLLLFQAYPLPRGGGFSVTLAYTGELADAGACPLIYPEGRMHHPDEALPPFRDGPSVLARDLRLPVVPVGLTGAAACLPVKGRFPRFGRIRVRFGAPLQVTDAERSGEIDGFTRRLEEAVRSLSG